MTLWKLPCGVANFLANGNPFIFVFVHANKFNNQYKASKKKDNDFLANKKKNYFNHHIYFKAYLKLDKVK